MNFSWDELKNNLQKDALSDGKTKYTTDTRFYKLARNENDTGGALLRFLPDPEGVMFVKMIRINANNPKNKRFCNDWSPVTIGQPDPFREKWQELWNAGQKEEAKQFGRSIRYIANVKVIKDPANPANEGKIFLLDMAKSTFEKLENAADPSPDERALGTEPMQIFNPIKGNSFLYKIKRESNGFLSYSDSKFDEKITGLYKDENEYLEDIKANGYKLNDFLKPEAFKSYEELKDCLLWFTGEKDGRGETEDDPKTETSKKPESTPVEAKPEPKEEKNPEPKTENADELDDLESLLDDL